MTLPSESVPHVPYKVVIEGLRAAYQARQPWSLIRLGDGESAILGYPEVGHPVNYRRWMSNFFGSHAGDDALYAPLKADLEQAIRGADVIGTSEHRLTDPGAGAQVLHDMGGLPKRTPEQSQALNGAERLFLNHHLLRLGELRGLLTHANIHVYMEQQGVLADLIGLSRAVTLIGCRDVAANLSTRFPGTAFRHLRIPGEYNWEPQDARQHWQAQKPHYPDVYNDLRGQLQAGGFDELVLVGAGPCGKVYCDDVRRAGGFAIDIGSIMDMWAGVMTRSYMHEKKTVTF